jgi:hypothetical protein
MYKIQWSNHSEEEATWETEDFLRSNYPDCLPKEIGTLPYPSPLPYESKDKKDALNKTKLNPKTRTKRTFVTPGFRR